jgi:hypothetical protein
MALKFKEALMVHVIIPKKGGGELVEQVLFIIILSKCIHGPCIIALFSIDNEGGASHITELFDRVFPRSALIDRPDVLVLQTTYAECARVNVSKIGTDLQVRIKYFDSKVIGNGNGILHNPTLFAATQQQWSRRGSIR